MFFGGFFAVAAEKLRIDDDELFIAVFVTITGSPAVATFFENATVSLMSLMGTQDGIITP